MKHTTASPKPIIQAAKVDSPDPQLSQGRCTHDAWLDSDIEICFPEYAGRVGLENVVYCNKLRMACSLRIVIWEISFLSIRLVNAVGRMYTYTKRSVGIVHPFANDLTLVDKNAPNRNLISLEGHLCLHRQGQVRKPEISEEMRRGCGTMSRACRMNSWCLVRTGTGNWIFSIATS